MWESQKFNIDAVQAFIDKTAVSLTRKRGGGSLVIQYKRTLCTVAISGWKFG